MKFWLYALVGCVLALLWPWAWDLMQAGNPIHYVVDVAAMGLLYLFGTICYNDGRKSKL